MSTKLPMATREKMAPHTAAMPALPRSVRVRSMASRITGSRAAGANVEMNAAVKASQLSWKAMCWGPRHDQGLSTLLLCSLSTG